MKPPSSIAIHRAGVFCAVLLFALPAILPAAERMVPGEWEFTMVTDGATRTFSSCMTAADGAQINGDSNSGRAAAEKKSAGRCTVQAYEIKGDSVTYTLLCGTRTIASATSFHGVTSEGTLITTTDGKAVTAQVKARRVGACR